MSSEEIYQMLLADLNILKPDEGKEKQLKNLIQVAKEFIGREGLELSEPYTYDTAHLVTMYAAYLYRKRATDEPMPRMLRWALNNQIMSRKAGEEDADG